MLISMYLKIKASKNYLRLQNYNASKKDLSFVKSVNTAQFRSVNKLKSQLVCSYVIIVPDTGSSAFISQFPSYQYIQYRLVWRPREHLYEMHSTTHVSVTLDKVTRRQQATLKYLNSLAFYKNWDEICQFIPEKLC